MEVKVPAYLTERPFLLSFAFFCFLWIFLRAPFFLVPMVTLLVENIMLKKNKLDL